MGYRHYSITSKTPVKFRIIFLNLLYSILCAIENTGICVTDSILDCIAIYERTGKPCIVLNSLDIKNEV